MILKFAARFARNEKTTVAIFFAGFGGPQLPTLEIDLATPLTCIQTTRNDTGMVYVLHCLMKENKDDNQTNASCCDSNSCVIISLISLLENSNKKLGEQTKSVQTIPRYRNLKQVKKY